MSLIPHPTMLAAVPELGGYFNLIKIGVVIALLLGWAGASQWIDRDTHRVKTKREQWNVIVMSGAVVGAFVLFVPPWKGWLMFFVGLILCLLIAGGAILAYVIHRNGRVAAGRRVLTMGHLQRLMKSRGQSKIVADKGQRVRIFDSAGKDVTLPNEPEERLDYQATQDFLFELLWRRSSDADILAGRERYRIVYRIDGVVTEKNEGLPAEEGERVFRYLKKVAGLNVAEIRRPQLGHIRAGLLGASAEPGKTTVQTSGTTQGERMRLQIQGDVLELRTTELGLSEKRHEQLKAVIDESIGLCLFGTPPRSGRTTTQYAVLRAHDAYIQNIHALERRALLDLDNVTQHIYEGSNDDVDYARRLQTVLRREPDIVMIGECEDAETAQIASRAAADDRKIYMGIDAKDCFDALERYLKLVDSNKLAAKALVGIASQRLVRRLCTQCRQAFRPDPATLKKLNLPAAKIEHFYRPPTEPILDKKGNEIICQACQGTGYYGRTGVVEIMVGDGAVKALIANGAPMNRIKAQCRKNKMYYLQEEGLLRVIDGTTSLNEILRILKNNEK